MCSLDTTDSRYGGVCHAGSLSVGPPSFCAFGLCLFLATGHLSLVTALLICDSQSQRAGSSCHRTQSITDTGKCVTRGLGCRLCQSFPLPTLPFLVTCHRACHEPFERSLVPVLNDFGPRTSDFGLCFSPLVTRHCFFNNSLPFHQHRGEKALTSLFSSISWRGEKQTFFLNVFSIT